MTDFLNDWGLVLVTFIIASGIAGIQGVFWQTDEGQTVADATSASLDATDGTIRFKTATAGNAKGWLLLFIDPAVSKRVGYPGR